MGTLLVWLVVGLVAGVLLDRLLLRAEARGWINYRRRGLSRGGAAYHTLTLHSIFHPGAEHLQEVRYQQVEERDDSGDPPPPDDSPATSAPARTREYREARMKTMSCRQLGGACDKEFRAETFETMAELSKQHGMEMLRAQDPAHLAAMQEMQALMRDPDAMRRWFDAKRREFDSLPDR